MNHLIFYFTTLMKKLKFHLLGTGHFALEEDGQEIADHIRRFLNEGARHN